MIIIDDFIPKGWQEEIKDTLFSSKFPWFYIADITHSETDLQTKAPGFGHKFVLDGEVNSQFYSLVAPMAHLAADAGGFIFERVWNCRTFLQVPLNPNNIEMIDRLHVDIEEPHMVLLYYVNDNDAQTVIVNKDLAENNYVAEHGLFVDDYEVIHRITPKQGRAVIFDGRWYHAVEQTTKGERCIINFNMV